MSGIKKCLDSVSNTAQLKLTKIYLELLKFTSYVTIKNERPKNVLNSRRAKYRKNSFQQQQGKIDSSDSKTRQFGRYGGKYILI